VGTILTALTCFLRHWLKRHTKISRRLKKAYLESVFEKRRRWWLSRDAPQWVDDGYTSCGPYETQRRGLGHRHTRTSCALFSSNGQNSLGKFPGRIKRQRVSSGNGNTGAAAARYCIPTFGGLLEQRRPILYSLISARVDLWDGAVKQPPP
jgi:hypothetical protein